MLVTRELVQRCTRVRVPLFSASFSWLLPSGEEPGEGGPLRSSFRESTDSLADALAEQHQRAGIERSLFLIAGQPCEVLQVWVLRNLFRQLPVRVLELRLDDERTQRHAQGLRNISRTAGEQAGVFGLELIPWDAVGQLHPSVVRVHMQPHGLVEVKERMLGSVGWSVHGFLLHFVVGFGVKLQGKSMSGSRTPAIILS